MPASTLSHSGTYPHHVMQPLLPQLSNPDLVDPDFQGPSETAFNGRHLWIPVIGSVRFPESQAPLSDPGPPIDLVWDRHAVTATTAR